MVAGRLAVGSMLLQNRIAQLVGNRVAMVESRVVMVGNRAVIPVCLHKVEMVVLALVRAWLACPGLFVAGSRVVMVGSRVVMKVVMAVEGARIPDQARSGRIDAVWELFQYYSVDKTVGNPGP